PPPCVPRSASSPRPSARADPSPASSVRTPGRFRRFRTRWRYEPMLVPYKAEHVPSLPAKSRPLLRYRREEFGFIAAFPNGRVGMFEPAAEPLLQAGSSYEECKPYLVTRLRIPTEFHFSAPLMAWIGAPRLLSPPDFLFAARLRAWIELTRACTRGAPPCSVEAGPPRGVERAPEP